MTSKQFTVYVSDPRTPSDMQILQLLSQGGPAVSQYVNVISVVPGAAGIPAVSRGTPVLFDASRKAFYQPGDDSYRAAQHVLRGLATQVAPSGAAFSAASSTYNPQAAAISQGVRSVMDRSSWGISDADPFRGGGGIAAPVAMPGMAGFDPRIMPGSTMPHASQLGAEYIAVRPPTATPGMGMMPGMSGMMMPGMPGMMPGPGMGSMSMGMMGAGVGVGGGFGAGGAGMSTGYTQGHMFQHQQQPQQQQPYSQWQQVQPQQQQPQQVQAMYQTKGQVQQKTERELGRAIAATAGHGVPGGCQSAVSAHGATVGQDFSEAHNPQAALAISPEESRMRLDLAFGATNKGYNVANGQVPEYLHGRAYGQALQPSAQELPKTTAAEAEAIARERDAQTRRFESKPKGKMPLAASEDKVPVSMGATRALGDRRSMLVHPSPMGGTAPMDLQPIDDNINNKKMQMAGDLGLRPPIGASMGMPSAYGQQGGSFGGFGGFGGAGVGVGAGAGSFTRGGIGGGIAAGGGGLGGGGGYMMAAEMGGRPVAGLMNLGMSMGLSRPGVSAF
jgi:hypothetical protein